MILFISFQSLTSTGAGGTGKIAYEVAKNLSARKHPVKLIVSSKGKFTTPFASAAVSSLSRYYLYILNNFIVPLLKPYQKRYLEERIFDFFCSRHIHHEQKLIFSTTPFLPQSFKKAKRLGIPIIFFPGTPEENHIAELVSSEAKKWKVSSNDVYTFKPRLSMFNQGMALVDYVICHSSVIESTFRKRRPDKKFISCRGLLKPGSIAEKQITQAGTFKVLYAAHTVWLKGLQYLLKAWSELPIEGELVIVGSIDPSVQQVINHEFSALKNVTYTGPVSGIDAYIENASVLVCPSLIDGGPVTVMEAMRFGVPSILTDACGVKDFLRDGETGWIIEAANVNQLRDRLMICYGDRNSLQKTGAAAQRMLAAYDFNSFIENIGSETLALQK